MQDNNSPKTFPERERMVQHVVLVSGTRVSRTWVNVQNKNSPLIWSRKYWMLFSV